MTEATAGNKPDFFNGTGKPSDKKTSALKKPVFKGEVLICEDNSLNQQIICEHFKNVGLKTVVADNGRIGVDKVFERAEKGEKQFDLIFMDIYMPEMDGIEAAKKIIGSKITTPIIAMTANVSPDDIELYRQHGMADHLTKPISSQELWQCLLKYLKPVKEAESIKNSPLAQADKALQIKLMGLFISENKDKMSQINKAIDDNDIVLAHRLAHTLKGQAGLLGKKELQKAATEVEDLLKDGVNRATSANLNELDREIQKAINEFSSLISD
jgi:CheY-like chemotaxis protein